jgi:hypothetical protein
VSASPRAALTAAAAAQATVSIVTAGLAAAGFAPRRAFALAATVVFVVSALRAPPLGALAEHAGWDGSWLTAALLAAAGAAVAAALAAGTTPLIPSLS